MAFTFDAKTASSFVSSSGLTQAHTTGATAKLLTCGIAIRGDCVINSITYGGNALTLAAQAGLAGDYERTALYYLVNPPTGSNNLVVSLSNGTVNTVPVEHAVSISTYVTSNAPSLDVTATNTNPGGVNTLATSVAGAVGSLGVDCASTEANTNPPFTGNGADQVVLHNFGSGSFGLGTSYEIGVTATEQFNWTAGGADTWAHVVAIFKEASGTASSDTRNVRTTGQAVSSDTRNVRVTASAPATPQKLRPIADVSIGAWTTEAAGSTNLYQSIDETSANDADYIQSSQSPGSPDIYKVRLSPAGLPESGTSYVRWRYEKDNATASIDLTVRLCKSDGITEIDSEALPNITDSYVDGSFTWDASVLTAEELGEGLVLVFEALAS